MVLEMRSLGSFPVGLGSGEDTPPDGRLLVSLEDGETTKNLSGPSSCKGTHLI